MIGLNEGFGGTGPAGEERAGRLSLALQTPETIFGEEGVLPVLMGLEYRPEQESMALAVAQAMSSDTSLLFEAGTGVGKSLAYLVPGIIQSIESKRPFIVSTHTISLQEQVHQKDLQLCRDIFTRTPGFEKYAGFETALLVGRGNYLCGTRLAQALETRSELFPSRQQADLERIVEWSRSTDTGMLQDMPLAPDPEVWDWVNAEGSACNRRNCTPENCFYRRAREQIRKSQVIIVNHSLLFALIGAGAQPRDDTAGVLFPQDFVVLDEAHTVHGIATDHFGEFLSAAAVRRQLLRLYNPGKGKARGLLVRFGSKADCRVVDTALQVSRRFFEEIGDRFLADRKTRRLLDADWIQNPLDEPFREIAHILKRRANDLDEGPSRDELNGMLQIIQSQRQSLSNCLELAEEDHVYWLEDAGKRKPNPTMRSAPVDIAPYLRQALFMRKTSVTLTSATLAEGTRIDSFAGKIGAWGQPFEQVYSPFDFEQNMRIYVAEDAPVPEFGQAAKRRDRGYLVDCIFRCCTAFRGGSLVLFTNYSDLHYVAGMLQDRFREAGRELLAQGAGSSRAELIRRLKSLGNAVLFGTDSFWTGIDVPGPALSQVVMTRLPFENPSHPVAEARAEKCRDEGGNPFADIQIPEALVKFRQGIGRLIRNRTDVGTVTLLDSRLLHRPYGREFIAVLPHADLRRFRLDSFDADFIPLEKA